MTPGESVTVDVKAPDSSLAQRHVVTADDSGNFRDTFVVPAAPQVGSYSVVATGQTSGVVEQ